MIIQQSIPSDQHQPQLESQEIKNHDSSAENVILFHQTVAGQLNTDGNAAAKEDSDDCEMKSNEAIGKRTIFAGALERLDRTQ